MGTFLLHNYCVLCSLGYLKALIEPKSRLPFPEFSGYHCIYIYIFNPTDAWVRPIKPSVLENIYLNI